jgi:hypothetical protein
MKKVLCYALAAGLVLSAGCSKKEEPASKEVMPKAAAAGQAQSVTKDLTQKAEAVTAEVTEKAAAVAEKAKVAAQELSQKVQTTISELTVNKDDVMADLNLPVADIKTKAAGCGQPELLAYANTYKEVLLEKKNQLAALTETMKGMPIADLFGEKGKVLKAEVSHYTAQFAGLKERYSVYLDLLKKYGVDLSSFGI